MLVALDSIGSRIVSTSATKETRYSCPGCGEAVIPKLGQFKIWHYAHTPGSSCAYGTGETANHMAMKLAIGRIFQSHTVDYEVPFGAEHRADMVVRIAERKAFVVEVQHSPISVEAWESRTADYNALRLPVLWVWDWARLSLYMDKGEYRTVTTSEEAGNGYWESSSYSYQLTDALYRAPVEIRECHFRSFGRVYMMRPEHGKTKRGILTGNALYSVHLSYDAGKKTLVSAMPYTTQATPSIVRTKSGLVLVGMGEGVYWKPRKAA